jgi:acylphosphatase
LRIEGRVQGVGYRSFVERHAIALSIDGFVRNRRDGGVEAVIAGAPDVIDAMIEHCRRGPRGARIDMIKALDETENVATGFVIASTV